MTRRAIIRLSFVCVAFALSAVLTTACTTPYSFSNQLGVLPPTPPRPLWMGPVRPEAATAMRGAAAVTLTTTAPSYSHILVSISGGVPGQSYDWTLHSGSCGSLGAAIPVNGYPLVTYADGTAKAEGYAPQKLAPGTPYSVVIGSAATSTPPACADLVYGSM
jgi:hypothetical protein